MSSRQYILLAILAAALAALLTIPRTLLPADGSKLSGQTTQKLPISNNKAEATEEDETTRTKPRTRDTLSKPTIEETSELLRNTVIPVVDLPEQTLGKQVSVINKLIEAQGVAPKNLRIFCNDPDLVKIEIGDLKLRNVPIPVLLKYMIDRRRINYVIHEGAVELMDWNSVERPDTTASPGSYDPNDPFAEPGTPATPRQPLDPNDPFATER